MPGGGIHTVTVPGAVAGWDAMRSRFGKLPLADLLAPAIYYADEGFPVTDVIADYWAGGAARLAAEPLAAQTFLPNGRAPRAGEIFKNPRLAGIAAADCAERRGRFLRREDRGSDRRHLAREGRHDDAGGPEGLQARVGRSDFDDLSRMDGVRAAAEHAGHRGADDAEHHGAAIRSRSTASRARRRCT